jgi:hypothetical protein
VYQPNASWIGALGFPVSSSSERTAATTPSTAGAVRDVPASTKAPSTLPASPGLAATMSRTNLA